MRECPKVNHTYITQSAAFTAMNRIASTAKNGPVPVRSYWCPIHNGYHLTSQPLRKGYNNGR